MTEMKLKRRKLILIGAGILVTFILIGAVSYNLAMEGKADSRNQLSPAAASMPEKDKSLDAWGEVKYDKIYDISIDFPSIVTEIKVKEGDRVTLGQPLVLFDMSEYRGIMDKLEQQLAAGQAGLINIVQDTSALSADITQTQKDINKKTEEFNSETNADLRILQTSLSLAKKEADNAKRDVSNNQSLFDKGAISKETLDQYINILDQKMKALTDVENNIDKTKSSLKAELDQLNVSLKLKQAQLDQIIKSNNANTEKQNSSVAVSRIELDIMKNKSVKDYIKMNQIISNVKNGIIQNIGVITGTRLGVQNMPTMVLQLIDADSIVVSAEVDEEFIRNVTIGETVRIVPASDNSLTIPGVVTQISNVAVEKDGKRIVKVQVKPQDPAGVLKPGYSTDVYFPIK